jgi:hypothetical protein
MFLTRLIAGVLLCLPVLSATAQNTRITDRNQIGWYNVFGNVKLKKGWSLHGEYQWRRDNWVTHWQQGLLRAGLGYQLHPKLQARVGYAWAETFAYGDYPLNSLGRDFTEHRMFEMFTLSDKIGRVDITHRFMLEQRWIGRYFTADAAREDDYLYVNRARYMLRLQMPLQGATLDDGEFYAAVYDEIFLGFGKNVNENVYDQNRIGLLAGYRFGPKFRLEGGFLSQILQLGREITPPDSLNPNGRNVFQYNNGVLLNAVFFW